jgi:transposase
MKKSSEAIKVENLDHLGIVAGIIDEMELVEEVNKIVGTKTKESLTPGQVMKAMILNGLGFLSAPLYLFEEFFEGKATEHLIGEGILPEHLNDDRLGRALDKYHQSGITQLFTAIAIKAAEKFQVKMKSIHLDGSSMSVQGEYKDSQESIKEEERKSEVSEKEMTPIKDDKSVFVERLKEFKKQWTFEGICVADSALYSVENLSAMQGIKKKRQKGN